MESHQNTIRAFWRDFGFLLSEEKEKMTNRFELEHRGGRKKKKKRFRPNLNNPDLR